MKKTRQYSAKTIVPTRPVEHLIHLIRGQKVMLDADLAELYGVATKQLNQSVRRNLSRFPANFMFQLTSEEQESLRSQSVTSKEGRGGRRYPPYVFTEHGVIMLSAVLNSPRAIEMSIIIVNAFVRLRELMVAHKDIAARVEKLERGQKRAASVIEILVEDIDRLSNKVEQSKKPSPYSGRRIGYFTDDD